MEKAQRAGSVLSANEAMLWRAWKRACDVVTGRVAREIAEATGLSDPDHAVLTLLVDLGQGTLRQQDLANAMAWHKSRLSHHLSRMEQRALVRRRQTKANTVFVAITPLGRRTLRAARPVHTNAVRSQLIARVPRAERTLFMSLLVRLTTE
ncbi:MAG TPA: MarR family transcriptional regulator [Polyangiaceae bacterium]|jgi:DNA-binding MarR family transcriptional regulator|nr:MarR family transcriptional regulator [Polyangiaceae bacterium]